MSEILSDTELARLRRQREEEYQTFQEMRHASTTSTESSTPEEVPNAEAGTSGTAEQQTEPSHGGQPNDQSPSSNSSGEIRYQQERHRKGKMPVVEPEPEPESDLDPDVLDDFNTAISAGRLAGLEDRLDRPAGTSGEAGPSSRSATRRPPVPLVMLSRDEIEKIWDELASAVDDDDRGDESYVYSRYPIPDEGVVRCRCCKSCSWPVSAGALKALNCFSCCLELVDPGLP